MVESLEMNKLLLAISKLMYDVFQLRKVLETKPNDIDIRKASNISFTSLFKKKLC